MSRAPLSTPLQNYELQPPRPATDAWQAWAESLIAMHLMVYHDQRYENALADPSLIKRWLGMVVIGKQHNDAIKILHQFRAQEHHA